MLTYERAAWQAGCLRVAGLDEAGRGPLAGPVVAAAACFGRSFLEASADTALRGLTDSKQLRASERERFFALLTSEPELSYGIGRAEPAEIDAHNILGATYLAMHRALDALPGGIDHLLVDGRPVPGLTCPSTAIVGGDGASLSIAAASVLAKVTRDRVMIELDAEDPRYGFTRHKGYGTPEHLAALRRYGPGPWHRRSFAPVRAAAGETPVQDEMGIA